ncbi:MAG: potassium-transporting ATPase subunit KdpA [Parachlamydiaceae bacterium]|nr:potassium-transporting ATPase subunit KdpA [Parachlamydiaceae bacterium]
MLLKLLEFFFFIGLLATLAPLLGKYMSMVFTGEKTFMHPCCEWLEKLCYRIAAIDPKEEMTWKTYLKSLLLFNFLGIIFLLLILSYQHFLPLNPQNFPGLDWDLSLNTAISFVTNTNWQAYAGETTLSYFSQMAGLTSQNFLSAATGIGVFFALTRGFTGKSKNSLGNYWVDLIRAIVYLLLPLSLIFALILVSEGVIQTFSSYAEVLTLENNHQTIPLGPVASQVAIKVLGSNGGGFFSANSAHPFENPTGLTNFLQTLAIVLIPAATVFTYGLLIKSKKHSYLLLSVMGVLLIVGLSVSLYSEHILNPIFNASPLLEGKETRFGVDRSILWSTLTSATGNGSINAMLSSLSPFAGGVALFNLMLGGVVFGAVGIGICILIKYILMTVFLSGLMVGRTPEYLGKKIEKREIQWVLLTLLTPTALILIGAGITFATTSDLSASVNQGPHAITTILYAYSSAASNNGSAFMDLDANTLYYNLTLAAVMLVSRIVPIYASLAIAGSLGKKNIAPFSTGTFSTNSTIFAFLLLIVILTVGSLSFFASLSLGPIIEQILMLEGRTF